MKESEIPGVRYQLRCPECGGTTSTVLFFASFHDFEAWLGTGTGSLYRLDLDHVRYTGTAAEQLLGPAREREQLAGGRLVPGKEVAVCEVCNAEIPGMGYRNAYPAGEEVRVRAICLPPPSRRIELPQAHDDQRGAAERVTTRERVGVGVVVAVTLVAVAGYVGMILELGYREGRDPTLVVHGAGYACWGLVPLWMLVIAGGVCAAHRQWRMLSVLAVFGALAVVGVVSGWIEWLGRQLA